MLRTLALPAFAGSALVLGAFCVVTKRDGLRAVGAALALVAGMAAGNHFTELLEVWPAKIPAGEAEPAAWWSLERGWPALLPVTAAALALDLAALRGKTRAGWLAGMAVRVAVAAGVAGWLVEALPPFSRAGTWAVLFAVMVLNREAMVSADDRALPRWLMCALGVLWSATAAVVLIFAHSARFSELAMLMAVSLCGAGVVAAWGKLDAAALVGGPAAFLPPLLLAGGANTFSEVPVGAFACAALAPCTLWLLRLPRLARLPVPSRTAVAIALVLIPCVAAVVLAAGAEDLGFG